MGSDLLPPRWFTCMNLAAEQLQLESDPLVPAGGVDPHEPRLNRRDEVVPHLVQVVGVALENLA